MREKSIFFKKCWKYIDREQSVVDQAITTESEDEDDKDLKAKLILPI